MQNSWWKLVGGLGLWFVAFWGINAKAQLVEPAQPPSPPIIPTPENPGLPLTENDIPARPEHFMPAFSPTTSTGLIWGVNFISAPGIIDETRYQNGLSTGAKWNRWVFYWKDIEQSEGQFNWADQDATIQADLAHGLQTNAILLGTPGFYWTNSTDVPQGLYDSIFSDGSDTPGVGKSINPNNKWAFFTNRIVNRYKPGGILAQANGWGAGKGITHWAVWNEPDYIPLFWRGSSADYARLLKVGYLAAKHADSNSQIIFGALANDNDHLGFYNEVMTVLDGDPLAWSNGHFHDIMATHSYFTSWNAWFHVYRAGNTLKARNLNKPIWLDEFGVAAWNDYPGPVWDSQSSYRAAIAEQADYTIQAAFFAIFAGADAIFHFQLYDGCGNQVYGSNFPPHNGELCTSDGKLTSNPNLDCAGDAHGLFSNPAGDACFSQHPQAGSPRPHFNAFKVLTTYVQNVQPLFRLRPYGTTATNGPQEWIGLYQPNTGKRVIGLWARYNSNQVAKLPASDTSAQLIAVDGTVKTIWPQNGEYVIDLPAATNTNFPGVSNAWPIGGRPFVVVEGDSKPPVATINGELTGTAFQLSWDGIDNYLGSDLQDYTVKVAVNGAAPTVWKGNSLETAGWYGNLSSGSVYEFTVTARDNAGNVSPSDCVRLEYNGENGSSAGIIHSPSAIEGLDHTIYLPFIQQPNGTTISTCQ